MEDFYYGRLRPNELVKPSDPEFQKIDQQIAESLQMLKKQFSQEEFKQVEKLIDLQTDLISLQSALSFIQGYRMGSLMMIEVFNGEGRG